MTRARKGDVTIESINGMLRLRWRVEGERFCLNLGFADNRITRLKANQVSSTIAIDVLSGHFDRSLIKYGKRIKATDKSIQTSSRKLTLMQAYDEWFSALDSKTQHHIAARSWLLRDGVTWSNLCDRLLGSDVGLDAWNKRCRISIKFLESVPDQNDLLKRVTLLKYPGSKVGKTHDPNRQPFSLDEIKLILVFIESNYNHYFLFTTMLFLTGCRPSEIIGLRKKDFSEDFSTVVISESLARMSYGKGERIRKSTKTNTIRTLKIESELADRLCQISQILKPDDLLFKSAHGKPIDDRNYLKRIWKPTLLTLELPYRVPYACRHTMASRALESGLSPVAVAHLMGHSSPTLVLERYGHVISQPDLPTLF